MTYWKCTLTRIFTYWKCTLTRIFGEKFPLIALQCVRGKGDDGHMRTGTAVVLAAAAAPCSCTTWCTTGKGSSTRKVLPVPSVLSTPMLPPMSSASRRLIARPSPLPPYLRVVELSACTNGLKMSSATAFGMPISEVYFAGRRHKPRCPTDSMRERATTTELRAISDKP